MSLTLTNGCTISAIRKSSMKIPGGMTYVVHTDIACMMLNENFILNMVNERVSATENKIEV